MSRSTPSILFVFADQLRGHDLGCMGNVDVVPRRLGRQRPVLPQVSWGYRDRVDPGALSLPPPSTRPPRTRPRRGWMLDGPSPTTTRRSTRWTSSSPGSWHNSRPGRNAADRGHWTTDIPRTATTNSSSGTTSRCGPITAWTPWTRRTPTSCFRARPGTRCATTPTILASRSSRAPATSTPCGPAASSVPTSGVIDRRRCHVRLPGICTRRSRRHRVARRRQRSHATPRRRHHTHGRPVRRLGDRAPRTYSGPELVSGDRSPGRRERSGRTDTHRVVRPGEEVQLSRRW